MDSALLKYVPHRATVELAIIRPGGLNGNIASAFHSDNRLAFLSREVWSKDFPETDAQWGVKC